MAKHLVIVESPAKAKTIAKYLGKDFEIKASFGHVRDLPEKKIGVDIKNDFEPTYVPMKDKAKILKELQSASKKSQIIYLATDPDREGEAIAWHIVESAKLPADKIKRVVFHEITKNAVQAAIANSRSLNMNLVDAQQARRILDRLIGYKLSPILSKKIRRGLSAGRVQSVAVKIVCDREKEIQAFIPQEYWNIDAKLVTDHKKPLTVRLFAKNKPSEKYSVHTEQDATSVVEHLNGSSWQVEEVKKSDLMRHPQPPFITSTIQQEASRKLNWSAKKTMMVAQQLYEGVDIHGESIGLITYMRTDSFRVSDEATTHAKVLIEERYGKPYVQKKNRVYKQKQSTQDAHEAIRPTYIDKIPVDLKPLLSTDHYKLYRLIWDRFIASCMTSAQLESTAVITKATSPEATYFLKATGSVIVFDGFITLYQEGKDDADTQEEDERLLPSVDTSTQLTPSGIQSEQKFTMPPFRYTEATLVKALEEKGIGRPSTYAPTLSVIQDRGYIEKDKKQLKPSELGVLVNSKLEIYFNRIIDLGFTAEMEEKLDRIMDGHYKWQTVLQEFYTPFECLLKEADQNMEKIDNTQPTDEICDKCQSPMVIKQGRFGAFIACSNYPTCKNTRSVVKDLESTCPKCSKALREKKSKKGKLFYGCSGYPDCTFASWDKPIVKQCDDCNSSVMFVKTFKGKETTYCVTCNPPAR